MLADFCEYNENNWIVPLRRVNFILHVNFNWVKLLLKLNINIIESMELLI
jgi:hypothetical protein